MKNLGWVRVGRLMPPAQAVKVYRKHKKLYDAIQKVVPAGDLNRVVELLGSGDGNCILFADAAAVRVAKPVWLQAMAEERAKGTDQCAMRET